MAKSQRTPKKRKNLEAEIENQSKLMTRKLLKMVIEDEYPQLELNRKQIDFVVDMSQDSILEVSCSIFGAHLTALEREANRDPDDDDDDETGDNDDSGETDDDDGFEETSGSGGGWSEGGATIPLNAIGHIGDDGDDYTMV